ncbi:MAG: sigma-70 family RNA polymerase sigma factor [bacterium]|nr:sigma-70 family RNA polymerase sigma factor [bacterium]
MTMNLPTAEVTALLDAWSQGDPEALAQLMEVVQKELHQIASRAFKKERAGHTLQPTAVVHELYLKLTAQRQVPWQSRGEFFSAAAGLMRNILVDHARKHRSRKRGGQAIRIPLEDVVDLPNELAPEVIALNDALIELARRSRRQSRIVEMRIFVGLTLEEIAAVEKIALSTVSREWTTAKLFLLCQLQGS